MSKYKQYKPSSSECIGEIPFHWMERKFKHVSYMKGRIGWQGLKNEEFTFEPDQPFLITGMNFKDGAIDWDEVYHIPYERYYEAPEIQLIKGDVLMTKDGTIGKLLFVDEIPFPHKASLNSHLLVFRPFYKEFFPKYLYYQLQSEPFFHHIELTKTGTTFFGITQEAVGIYKLILPPLNEQKIIAKYIDEQTQKVNQLITNKKAQAEKLKELRQIEINNAVTKGLNPNAEMKDSGINWLGEIPEHWQVKRLKNVANYIQTGVTPPSEKSEYYDGDIAWYGPGGFTGDTVLNNPAKYITQQAIDDHEAKLFPVDCVFMIGIGATIGKVGIIKQPSSCNQQLNIINFKKHVNPDFGVYFLKVYENIIINIANFSTLPIYNQVQTGSLKFLVPPIEEQVKIANYLQQRIAFIDNLLKNIQAQIEKLQELRKVKIYEAVTGKIKVNAYAEATA